MKKNANSVVLLKSLFWSLFLILGICLGACSSNDNGDEILSLGFTGFGEPLTGHYMGYEVKSRIPVDSETIEITLFVGHRHNINHFYWNTENGREWVSDEERAKLDFSIELYSLKHPRHETIVESFDYLSDDYLIDVVIITDPVPEYITPMDEKVVYSSNFKITLDVKDVIIDEYGEIKFYVCQIDREKGDKESFESTSIYYEIIEDEIVFSTLRKPVPYDYTSAGSIK